MMKNSGVMPWLLTAVLLAAWSCAAASAYEQAHPDVVAKAVTAVKLAQCVDDAVTEYSAQQKSQTAADVAQPRPLDPNPYVDAGAAPASAIAPSTGAPPEPGE